MSEILGLHGIRKIGIRMTRARVVIAEIFDHSECRYAEFIERYVIRAPDSLDDIAAYSQLAQRLEPGVEDSLGGLVRREACDLFMQNINRKWL